MEQEGGLFVRQSAPSTGCTGFLCSSNAQSMRFLESIHNGPSPL